MNKKLLAAVSIAALMSASPTFAGTTTSTKMNSDCETMMKSDSNNASDKVDSKMQPGSGTSSDTGSAAVKNGMKTDCGTKAHMEDKSMQPGSGTSSTETPNKLQSGTGKKADTSMQPGTKTHTGAKKE
ncbi:hypothetical protein [Sneathiella sp.]|uniref:hypothetical protein n=1 Tax=Sneathiella sp. TaxID=1964365 RepID=UPI003561EFF8